MEFGGRILVAILSFLLNAHLGVMIELPECDGSGSVTYLGASYRSISSHCNCSITTNYTGKLYFASTKCSGTIDVLNHNQSIRLPCTGKQTLSAINVVNGDILYLISTNISNLVTESTILNRKIKVYAHSSEPELFAVKCGAELGSSTTIGTSSISTKVSTEDSTEHLPKPSGMVHAVAAGGIVVAIVLTILAIVYLRKRNHICSIKEQYANGIKSDLYADSRVELPYNLNRDIAGKGVYLISGKVNIYIKPMQDLPDYRRYRPLHSGADDGLSNCGFGNLLHRENLPDNPVFRPYQDNIDDEGYSTVDNIRPKLERTDNHLNHSYKRDWDGNSTKVKYNPGPPRYHEMLNCYQQLKGNVSDSTSVYTQPYENAAVANININDPTEKQNETVYAQVCKPKKK